MFLSNSTVSMHHYASLEGRRDQTHLFTTILFSNRQDIWVVKKVHFLVSI